jgi:DNA-binding LacI/PurR family transcriptional regulator
MEQVKPRLQDIATRAGVSVPTVSRVLNGQAGVAEQTRRAVLAEVELLGYTRRHRHISPRRRGRVGVIVPELENPIFPHFVHEIENSLAAHGFLPLLCTATPVIDESEYIDVLLDEGIAGLVIVAGRNSNTEADKRQYHQLLSAGTPLALVNGTVEGLPAPSASTDDGDAVRKAVKHLQALGHSRIGCVIGPARYVTTQRRVDSFLRATSLRRSGPATGHGEHLVVRTWWTLEGGYAATETLLDRGVTAVVCGNDLMALGAVRAARARGLSVPWDISVVGYDDSPMLTLTDPPLTTMRQNVAGISRHIVSALVDEIHGEPPHRQEMLFAAELVVRGSTAPPGATRS